MAADAPQEHFEPNFAQSSMKACLSTLLCSNLLKAKKTNLAWMMSRMIEGDQQEVPTWSGFNQALSTNLK